MNNPNNERLVAMIHGKRCTFDGEQWECEDASLAESLDLILELVPQTHTDLRQLAEVVFRRAGLTGVARVTGVEKMEPGEDSSASAE